MNDDVAKFIKMHGLGNDYIFIPRGTGCTDIEPRLVRMLSDRHTGIGGDGVVLFGYSTDPSADIFMIIYNSDGSRASMCGNALRCLARYHFIRVDNRKSELYIKVGHRTCKAYRDQDDPQAEIVHVIIGKPSYIAQDIPLSNDAPQEDPLKLKIDDSLVFEITTVSMGNPHAVIFVDDLSSVDLALHGKFIENHGWFLDKANVGFIEIRNAHHIKARIWERGAGATLACGSGACAAVAAGVKRGLLKPPVTVEMTKGNLEIDINENGEVIMSGPATIVCEGTIYPEFLEAV